MFSLYYLAKKFLSSFEIMRSCLVISLWTEKSDAVKLQQHIFINNINTTIPLVYIRDPRGTEDLQKWIFWGLVYINYRTEFILLWILDVELRMDWRQLSTSLLKFVFFKILLSFLISRKITRIRGWEGRRWNLGMIHPTQK